MVAGIVVLLPTFYLEGDPTPAQLLARRIGLSALLSGGVVAVVSSWTLAIRKAQQPPA
jgi:hypothetical protein